MTRPFDESTRLGLREWLRSEQRLGIGHLVAPQRAAPTSVPAAPTPRSERAGVAPPGPRTAAAARPAPAPAAVLPTRRPLPADPPDLPPLVTTELSVKAAAIALETLDAGFVRGCTRCELCENRTQTVFGTGHARPRLVFVGEGPGADEDRQGEPFVGRAGELLTRMIGAMTLSRDQVYIANVVKCRPPGNRTPTDREMETCSPFLFRQLAILHPEIIVTLGNPATQTLLATKTGIGQLRGRFHDFPPPGLNRPDLPPARLMPTYHPAYLLRNPNDKGKVWDDLKQVMAALGIAIPSK